MQYETCHLKNEISDVQNDPTDPNTELDPSLATCTTPSSNNEPIINEYPCYGFLSPFGLYHQALSEMAPCCVTCRASLLSSSQELLFRQLTTQNNSIVQSNQHLFDQYESALVNNAEKLKKMKKIKGKKIVLPSPPKMPHFEPVHFPKTSTWFSTKSITDTSGCNSLSQLQPQPPLSYFGVPIDQLLSALTQLQITYPDLFDELTTSIYFADSYTTPILSSSYQWVHHTPCVSLSSQTHLEHVVSESIKNVFNTRTNSPKSTSSDTPEQSSMSSLCPPSPDLESIPPIDTSYPQNIILSHLPPMFCSQKCLSHRLQTDNLAAPIWASYRYLFDMASTSNDNIQSYHPNHKILSSSAAICPPNIFRAIQTLVSLLPTRQISTHHNIQSCHFSRYPPLYQPLIDAVTMSQLSPISQQWMSGLRCLALLNQLFTQIFSPTFLTSLSTTITTTTAPLTWNAFMALLNKQWTVALQPFSVFARFDYTNGAYTVDQKSLDVVQLPTASEEYRELVDSVVVSFCSILSAYLSQIMIPTDASNNMISLMETIFNLWVDPQQPDWDSYDSDQQIQMCIMTSLCPPAFVSYILSMISCNCQVLSTWQHIDLEVIASQAQHVKKQQEQEQEVQPEDSNTIDYTNLQLISEIKTSDEPRLEILKQQTALKTSGVQFHPIICCLFPFHAMLNHSCRNNSMIYSPYADLPIGRLNNGDNNDLSHDSPSPPSLIDIFHTVTQSIPNSPPSDENPPFRFARNVFIVTQFNVCANEQLTISYCAEHCASYEQYVQLIQLQKVNSLQHIQLVMDDELDPPLSKKSTKQSQHSIKKIPTNNNTKNITTTNTNNNNNNISLQEKKLRKLIFTSELNSSQAINHRYPWKCDCTVCNMSISISSKPN